MEPQGVAGEEEGDPEGAFRREVGGELLAEIVEVPGIEPEGEGVLLRHEGVRLERAPDHGQGGAVDRAPEVVQEPVPRVVLLDLPLRLLQGQAVRLLPPLDSRGEPGFEEADQAQRHLRIGREGPVDLVVGVVIRLDVGQRGMAEGDEGVDEGRLVPRHPPRDDEFPVSGGGVGEDQGVEQLLLELPDPLLTRREDLLVPSPHVERPQEPGLDPGADGECVCPAHSQPEPVEDFHDLGEEPPLGRIRHGQENAALPPLPGRFGLLETAEHSPVGPSHVEKPDDPGHPAGGGKAQVGRVVLPEDLQEPPLEIRRDLRILLSNRRKDPSPDRLREGGAVPRQDLLFHLPVHLVSLHFEEEAGPRDGGVGVGHLRVGDLPLRDPADRLIEGPGDVEAGHDERLFPLREEEEPVLPEALELPAQRAQSPRLPAHRFEKDRGHVGLEPAKVLPRAAFRACQEIFHLPVQRPFSACFHALPPLPFPVNPFVRRPGCTRPSGGRSPAPRRSSPRGRTPGSPVGRSGLRPR